MRINSSAVPLLTPFMFTLVVMACHTHVKITNLQYADAFVCSIIQQEPRILDDVAREKAVKWRERKG